MAASLNFPNLPAGWVELENQMDESHFVRIFHSSAPKFKRALFVVHGFGEHSGRYLHFPHYLQDTFDVLFAIDLPGHGCSKGPRGHSEDPSVFHDCVEKTFAGCQKWLAESGQSCDLHIFGHSFGGLTLAHMAMTSSVLHNLPAKSVTLSAPFLGFGFPVPFLKKKFGILIEPYLGSLPMKAALDLKHLSHDESVIDAYMKDPLNHSWITPRMFINMGKMMEGVSDSKADFPYPWAVFLPLADQVSSVETTQKFYEKHAGSSRHKHKLYSYRDLFHEGFNEVGKEKLFKDLSEWILNLES